jgi:HipA-like protein
LLNGVKDLKYTPQDIGRLVRETRKGLGVTQKELALTSGTGLENQLAKPGAAALSQSLPLRKEFFPAKECRGFFGGILLEESKREIIAHWLRPQRTPDDGRFPVLMSIPLELDRCTRPCPS